MGRFHRKCSCVRSRAEMQANHVDDANVYQSFGSVPGGWWRLRNCARCYSDTGEEIHDGNYAHAVAVFRPEYAYEYADWMKKHR